jgi:hypothetical protein
MIAHSSGVGSNSNGSRVLIVSFNRANHYDRPRSMRAQMGGWL